MQWDRNSRGCLDAITNYHRVSSRSKYTGEARTKSCVPIGIILVIGFVVSRNIHRCGVRLPTPLVFARDKTVTIRSLVSNYETASCFIFIFDSKIGRWGRGGGQIFSGKISRQPRLRSWFWSFILLVSRGKAREYREGLRLILKSVGWGLKFFF